MDQRAMSDRFPKGSRPRVGGPRACAALAIVGALACAPDEVPFVRDLAPAGEGARVVHELYPAETFNVPLPNDLLTIPDRESRTGLRLDLPQGASPHDLELRATLNELEGWGITGPLSVSFDLPRDDPAIPALDLENLAERHSRDDYSFGNDAVYLVNLETGLPVPLELGEGSFALVYPAKPVSFAGEPRGTEPVLELETVDERIDPGSAERDPRRTEPEPVYDSDFDGHLDLPNLGDPEACPNQARVALGQTTEAERTGCISERLLPWYERETDTLLLRPLLPLEERIEYAVVLTERLTDSRHNPVRSPFSLRYHPGQTAAMQRLRRHLNDPSLAQYYGDLAGSDLSRVAFAWTFTTAPAVEDLRLLRDGLRGEGPFARLAAEYPADFTVERLQDTGEETEAPSGTRVKDCATVAGHPYVIDFDQVLDRWQHLTPAELGLTKPSQQRALLAALSSVDHLVLATYTSPFFLAGGPRGTDPAARFAIDFASGHAQVWGDTVQVWLFVPKTGSGGARAQPFPVALYGHSYRGSVLEALSVAGEFAAQGLATVAINAVWHGPSPDDAQVLRSLFRDTCYARAATVGGRGRFRDLDGDGEGNDDAGADAVTPYVGHLRDIVRQNVVDQLQLLRELRTWDGHRGTMDYDGDGQVDPRGDFDGDGSVDLGGPKVKYAAWGQSLGGLVATMVGPLEPMVKATASFGSPGTLVDWATRTSDPVARTTFVLPLLGPMIVGLPARQVPTGKATRCVGDEVSLRMVALDSREARSVEIDCLDLRATTRGWENPGGGTVVLTNLDANERRCAHVTPAGEFQLALPAAAGSRLELRFYDRPDVVASFAPEQRCEVSKEAVETAVVDHFGAGTSPTGTTLDDGSVCSAEEGCIEFQGRYIPAGSRLEALSTGLGLGRQRPELRAFLALARHATSGADGMAFGPHYATNRGEHERGAAATASLVLAATGSTRVPTDVQVALARSMGIVPFLGPERAAEYPAYVEYVTPAPLWEQLGSTTPNRFLVANHVLEGSARLSRTPPAGECGTNEADLSREQTCGEPCNSHADCREREYCDEAHQRCRLASPSAADCAMSLFDVDALDEGRTQYGEQEAIVPLRLGRVAAPVGLGGVDAAWEPRVAGRPFRPDRGAWASDKPVLGLLFVHGSPLGTERLEAVDECQAFSTDRYTRQLVARFLATAGRDLYPLSHPSSHHCLARGDCDFIEP